MKIFTKESLIEELKSIRERGWVKSTRQGNQGGVGNTVEDLLGIEENNLPIPNAAEWELKCQRRDGSSLLTLFHMEPSPRALKFVPQILLPSYGWKHKEAGRKYSLNEMSFRQTIHAQKRSDRGFKIVIDRGNEQLRISFDANAVDEKHAEWLQFVKKRIGLAELSPHPYWGFDDFLHKAGTKLHNCFYLQAETKKIDGEEYFKYDTILMLKKMSIHKLLEAFAKGDIFVDFDARTGHNHGTKFRLKKNKIDSLYEEVIKI